MVAVNAGPETQRSQAVALHAQAEGHPIADPRRRDRAREYARLRRWLFFFDLLLSAAALLLLVATGLSVWLREQLASAGPGYFGLVAAFAAVLTACYSLLFLPLVYYGGFVLPHRFGLSVQTRRGWLGDYTKGTLVGLVELVIPALAVYALLLYSPVWWWLWAWVFGILFVITLVNLGPVLIFPLFFKFQPLVDEEIRRRLVALAEDAGARVRDVFVMDMSRRTRAANAALLGLGNTRRIVLGDTLWQRFGPDEIEAVLAHELGHHVHHDLWRGMALDSTIAFVGLWLADQLMRRLVGPLGLEGLADVAGAPLLLLVLGGLFVLLLPLRNGFSRRREAAADGFAVRVTRNVDAWKSALGKLADQNLAEVDPPHWAEWLLYSHPSPRHRLDAAEAARRTQRN